ncbi:GPI-anchored CFEM domain protein B [Penicillium diatomitis]|uniref:GPI-anchored CFEM domain protein B n=1 Tax=Penicillium diatomitis TaxID=2819901 RepID=A0A9W9XD69_9EURO|nr:GPI-anchored CFEM domain protein B [Penicillium diatomitis]KAJ5488572.1 GPI-anchored CFEM domain protein B [Penicillium diatomitis]
MKFSATLIALVAAGVAHAQLPNVPACSVCDTPPFPRYTADLNCFVTALTTDGCSSLTDFACHCSKPQLVSTITPCVQKACKVPDQISVSNAVVAQCSSAGHPIVVPPIETASSAASSAASTAAATTSAVAQETTTSAAEQTTVPMASSSSTSSVVMTAVTTTGWAVSTPVKSSTAMASSSHPAGSSKPTPTSSGAAAATTSPAYNAAGSIKGNMAGVAVVAAAAAYIL